MTHTAAPLPTDDALLEELRRLAAAADPVPAGWWDDAGAAFGWHQIAAEPAALAYHALSGRDPGLGRVQLAGRVLRELRWTGAGREVAVEVDVGDERLRLVGTVSPAAVVQVTAVWPDGHENVTTGEQGRFTFDDLPRRPMCLVVGGDQPLKTCWILR
jgi:hypothetical protein